MKSVFISFAVTGEDKTVYRQRMHAVCGIAQAKGVRHYCILNDDVAKQLHGEKAILSHALKQLQTYDVVVALITSSRRSEGMLIEIGAALAMGKPVYCLLHVSAAGKMYLPTLCEQVYEWSDETELMGQVSNFIEEQCRVSS